MKIDLDWQKVDRLIAEALSEDIGNGDITSELMLPSHMQACAEIVAKEPCRLAGLVIAEKVFKSLDPNVHIKWLFNDGDYCQAEQIGVLEGHARSIMSAERTALNFLQHLTGICTKTDRIVKLAGNSHVGIYDTRKTIPGWRALAKYAVALGGGSLHRWGLDDAVLVKRNHLELLKGNVDLKELFQTFKRNNPDKKIMIEASHLQEVEQIVRSGADVVLLDNFLPDQVSQVLKKWKGKAFFESTGRISAKNVSEYAATGVERISIGELTHTIKAIDFSLRILSS